MIKNFNISKSKRLRSTPFTSRIEKQGVKNYTVYNHMLLPTVFSNLEEEYFHLKEFVQVWDVSVQREIEISGDDSYKLVQLMTCRDLSKSKIGGCYYSPLVDKKGYLLNDPLIYRLNEKTWRVCIADSDVILYAKGIAETKNLKVNIFEASIDTLAVQGPKSDLLMSKIFGNEINKLKFFKFDFFTFDKYKYLVSKSGYSKQGGYEIHIDNVESGLILYDHFFDVGKEFNIKPGAPNLIERIEGGLLSYGNDITMEDNPFECGFDKYVNLESEIDFLGKETLKRIKEKGIKKKLVGVKIDTKSIFVDKDIVIYNLDKKKVGVLRSGTYSPHFKKVVGIAMIDINYSKQFQEFVIKINDKQFKGMVTTLPIT